MYDLDEIIRHMNDNYEELYKNNDNIAGYRDAVEWFDHYMKNSKELQNLVNKLIIKRQDPISSDREAAALAFALDEMGICDDIEGLTKEESVEEIADEKENKQSVAQQAAMLKSSSWQPVKHDKDNGTLFLISEYAYLDENGRENQIGLLLDINTDENGDLVWDYNHDEPYSDKDLQQAFEILEKSPKFNQKIETIIADFFKK